MMAGEAQLSPAITFFYRRPSVILWMALSHACAEVKRRPEAKNVSRMPAFA